MAIPPAPEAQPEAPAEAQGEAKPAAPEGDALELERLRDNPSGFPHQTHFFSH